MNHQIIIIGGGPAGSSAAYTLLKNGYDVLLIDKSSFPRNKLCGGLLTLRSKRVYEDVFGDGFEKSYDVKSTGAAVFQNATKLNEVDKSSNWYLTNRTYFDHFLLEKCIALGLKTIFNERVISIDVNTNSLSLSNGQLLNFNYLIGADGVNSIVAKQLFGQSFDKSKIGFALEVELPKSLNFFRLPTIHFDVVNWGYGWVFPKTNTNTFGIVGRHADNPKLKDRFQSFYKALYGEEFNDKINGHYIPFGDILKIPGRKNVLLTGDSAGLVDPITGEGIAFALESGSMAGIAVMNSFLDGKDALIHYKPLYKKLASELKIACRLSRLLYSPKFHRLFLLILPKGQELIRLHLQLMEEKISYRKFEFRLYLLMISKSMKILKYKFFGKATIG